jgi:hypothetical protein
MDKDEIKKELEWLKKQPKKEVNFTLPVREPDEPPATDTQIRYIKKITKDLDENEIRKLGIKQTASLIDQIKMEREMFTDELLAKRLEQKRGCLGTIILGVLLYVFIYLIM